jgi:hypothetical protein
VVSVKRMARNASNSNINEMRSLPSLARKPATFVLKQCCELFWKRVGNPSDRSGKGERPCCPRKLSQPKAWPSWGGDVDNINVAKGDGPPGWGELSGDINHVEKIIAWVCFGAFRQLDPCAINKSILPDWGLQSARINDGSIKLILAGSSFRIRTACSRMD